MLKQLCLLILFIPYLASGQKHWVGFCGGYNLSKPYMLEGRCATYIKSGHTYNFNLNYEYQRSKKMSIGVDLAYSKRYFNNWGALIYNVNGLPYQDTINNINYYDAGVKYDYHYLHLPIRVNFYWGSKVQYVIGLGLAPGILFRAKSTLTFNVYPDEISEENIVTNEVSRFDLTFRWENCIRFNFSNFVRMNLMLNFYTSMIPTINPDGIRDIDFQNKKYLFTGIELNIGLQFSIPSNSTLEKSNSSEEPK